MKKELEVAHKLEEEKERSACEEAHRLAVVALQAKVGGACVTCTCTPAYVCGSNNSWQKPLKQERQS